MKKIFKLFLSSALLVYYHTHAFAGCLASDPVGTEKKWKFLSSVIDVTSSSGMSLWNCKFTIQSNNAFIPSTKACKVNLPQLMNTTFYYDIISGSITYSSDCTYRIILRTKESGGTFAIGFNLIGVLNSDKQELSGTASQNWNYNGLKYAGGMFSMIRIQ